MSSAEDTFALPPRRIGSLARALRLLASSPRLLIYCACTVLTLLVSYHLGKEMAWDTLDYHLYAGFSALHDRFGQDYFAAGPQGYFNPYIFVPFYLLVRSGLTALEVSSILAIVQSAILWLTYELADAVAPGDQRRLRIVFAVCGVLFAFANPILLDQFGTSFSDVLTSEIVLLGWVLLVRAIRAPGARPILGAALVLGCACALKLTNAVHAIAAGLLVLFVPVGWRARLRYSVMFVLAMAAGFVIVSLPWSIRLAEHFGNPLFPLANGIFRSPDFTTAHLVDYRFLPVSFGAALWLPFALIAPRGMVDVEWAAPDLRYAVVLLAGVVALALWFVRRQRGERQLSVAINDTSTRILIALGCAFLADWTLWLAESGNGRYFIPMACVAAVLFIGLIFRLCSRQGRVRNYLLLAVFCAQFYQLHVGTEYPARLPWKDAPWFQVQVPGVLATQPALYFDFGVQSYSFLAAYLAPRSGLVNLEGSYTLASAGANGAHIESLIRRYAPHIWMVQRDIRSDASKDRTIPVSANADDALQPFGLKLDSTRCERIVVNGMPPPPIVMVAGRAPPKPVQPPTFVGYFMACAVVPGKPPGPELLSASRAAGLALDHLEDACPTLLQPARPATYLRGDAAHGYVWARQYGNTDMVAWVRGGWVYFQRLIGGGQQGYAGPERVWQKAPSPVSCGRGENGYFLRVLRNH